MIEQSTSCRHGVSSRGKRTTLRGTRDSDITRAKADQIHIRAAAALRENPHLFNHELNCHFHEGTLILRGVVSCYFHKQIAQTVVAGVKDVELIINQIEVDDSSDR